VLVAHPDAFSSHFVIALRLMADAQSTRNPNPHHTAFATADHRQQAGQRWLESLRGLGCAFKPHFARQHLTAAVQ
jgi:hypothetical protein